ncbi:MAG: HDIG domain-containing protein, partial [Candidatus Omnitrophica bacterium]|nr:HDIG domain-containing protein [Candidatus Omnitrophota bacterium]
MRGRTKMVNNNKARGLTGLVKRPDILSGILILTFIIATVLIMYVSPQVYRRSVHEGDIALKDIYAPYDFEYIWGLDEERTGARQAEAAAAVPFYLGRDEKVRQQASNRLNAFFRELARLKEAGIAPEEITESLKEKAPGVIPGKDIKTLTGYDDPAVLRDRTMAALDRVLDRGYIASEARAEMKARAGGEGYLFDGEDGTDKAVQADELVTGEEKEELVSEAVKKEFPSDRRIRPPVEDLIASVVSPNIVLDRQKTEKKIKKAVERVDPVYRTRTVKKNELVIGKGIRVDSQHIAQFERMRSMFGPGTTPSFLAGVIIFFGILLFIAAAHTLRTQKKPAFLMNTREIGITLVNMFLMIVIADFVMNQPQPSYFIPLAGMGMLITLLVGFNAGFMSVVIMGTLIAFLMAGKIEVFFVLLTGSMAGMLAVRGLRRRARILAAGLVVGAAKALAIVSIGLINGMEHVVLAKDAGWGVASGIFSGFLVMGLLPFFEHVFKVPTNISLLELSDLNHPLLKKLAMEAPGTYHHSIMVGNLSESACDSIGANSLLARVGAYYHDIGKIPKAEYFSENEMGAGSKHEKLAPSMSALIISKHVKEGVELGRQH